MSSSIVDNSFALGAAIHYDFELAATPKPFEVLVERLFGTTSPRGEPRHWFIDVHNRKAPPPAPLNLLKLVRLVAGGGIATAAVETAPNTADPDMILVRAGTAPIDKQPQRFTQTKCLYDAVAVCGSAQLHQVGMQHVLDAIVAFADAVCARAGAVYCADSAAYAAGLASCGGSPTLSREQIAHLTDLMYWRPRWGDIIRGPAWGTFLGAAHVERLGGVVRIERQGACAQVITLHSGGAFLQVTPIETPLIEGRDDGGVFARLSRILAPVMGQR
jgi:hypothetical protein